MSGTAGIVNNAIFFCEVSECFCREVRSLSETSSASMLWRVMIDFRCRTTSADDVSLESLAISINLE